MKIDEDYAQRANPISSIKAICDAYPLSIGLFRELLQNSDDAGALTQVGLNFGYILIKILDCILTIT